MRKYFYLGESLSITLKTPVPTTGDRVKISDYTIEVKIQGVKPIIRTISDYEILLFLGAYETKNLLSEGRVDVVVSIVSSDFVKIGKNTDLFALDPANGRVLDGMEDTTGLELVMNTGEVIFEMNLEHVSRDNYKIWLDNNHTGTEADYLTWLRKPAVDKAAELDTWKEATIQEINESLKVVSYPDIIGPDYYVYKWDEATKKYVKSNIYVKGADGKDGINGSTPIPNDITNTWWVNGVDTGVSCVNTGEKGDTFTFDDLTPEQLTTLQAQVANLYLSVSESQKGKIKLFGIEYDLYEMLIEIGTLPKVVDQEQTYVLKSSPLGFNLYLKAESLVVPKVSLNTVGDFFNESYKISRLFVDSDLNTKVTIKCISAVAVDVKAILHIEYIKDFGETIELKVTVSESVNTDNVNLTFPKLKYNKEKAITLTVDDSYSIYNNIFSVINKRWVDDELMSFFDSEDTRTFFYHLGFSFLSNGVTYKQTTGGIPSKFLEYSDGAGIRHRIGGSVGIWPWKFNGRDEVGGFAWPFHTPKEARLAYDFGWSCAYHDLKLVSDYSNENGNTLMSQSLYNSAVKYDADTCFRLIDVVPKVMINPNGDPNYARLSLNSSLIQYQVAAGLTADPTGFTHNLQEYKMFSSNQILDDKINERIVIRRLFYSTSYEDFLNKITSNQALPQENRVWTIFGIHRPSTATAEFLRTLESLYGVSGDDSMWAPSLDEFLEYWFMSNYAGVHKSVKGRILTFKIHVPCASSFIYKSISCLLSGISDLTGVEVTSSDNCDGTSYSINNNSLLVNLDFSDLKAKAEKYLTILEANPTQDYAYQDADYFVKQLKSSVRLPYQTRLDVFGSVPTLDSILVNGNDANTQSRNVTVSINSSGGVYTHAKVSESIDFTGAEWQVVSNNSIPFVLSTGFGVKTVYVKLKNTIGESASISDTIEYIDTPLTLTAISIDGANSSTNDNEVVIGFTGAGTPTHYMLSESSYFTGASWIDFVSNPTFILSAGFGAKTVYAKLKNASTETQSTSASIQYVDVNAMTLNSISLNNGDENCSSNVVNVGFNITGTPTHYRLGETLDLSAVAWIAWGAGITFAMSATNGLKTVYAQVKNVGHESSVVNDTITYIQPVVLSAISINSGAESTNQQAVSVALTLSGTPTHYRVGEVADLSAVAWIAWSGSPISYNLSAGNALKTVYMQIKNAASTSNTVSDTITLNIAQQAITVAVSISYGAANGTMLYDSSTEKTVNVTYPSHGAYSAKQFKDVQGNLVPWYMEMNSSFYGVEDGFPVAGVGLSDSTGGNPTLSGNTGPYADIFLVRNRYVNAQANKGRVVLTLPVGSYKIKIIWSSGVNMAVDATHLPYCHFRVDTNGIIGTPVQAGPTGFTALNNVNFNAEIDFTVAAEASGNVRLVLYNDYPSAYNYRPGINLMEIVKLS